MIPNIIHYCWFGKKKKSELALKCINSWRKMMPGYEIIEWNEENFNIHDNRYIEEAYNKQKYAFVSDYARLKILYENGGIYFDVDVEALKPITKNIIKNGYLAKENQHTINTGLGFACKKHEPIIKVMLDDYENIHFISEKGKIDLTPCTTRNTNSIKRYIKNNTIPNTIGNMTIYNPSYFNPLDYKTGILKITKNTYTIHHGEATWLDDIDRKLLRYRQKAIQKHGQKLGIKLYKIKKFTTYIIKKPNNLFKIITKHNGK